MSLKNTPIIQRYADGEVIVSEGIASNNAYIVLAGKVKITKKIDKKTVIIAMLQEGDVFGEMGLINNTLRSANASAIGDVTIGIIGREQFEELMKTVPDDLRAILKALVARLRITTEKLSRVGVELSSVRSALNTYSLKDK
ncbi:MAG: cyclic nucleotide-binding domain-containing protein [Nitrospinales bacterium]